MSFKYLNFVVNFYDPATIYCHSLISVHHDAMWYLFFIISIVYLFIFFVMKDYNWYTFGKSVGFAIFFFKYLGLFFFLFASFFKSFFFSYFGKKIHFIWESLFIFILLKKIDNLNDWYDSFLKFLMGSEYFLGFNLLNFFGYNFFNYFLVFLNSILINKLNKAFYIFNGVSNMQTQFLLVNNFRHSTYFEFVCASLPTLVILLILIPSTLLLYSLDEELEPYITFKVLGHQWFWSYEFNNWLNINNSWKQVFYNFDSTMLTADRLEFGSKRLLEVDKPLFVPVNLPLRFLITSTDVLHSWAVPELGVKIDAIPGRLSHYLILVRSPGFFFGQCSELCGVAHGFMPMVLSSL